MKDLIIMHYKTSEMADWANLPKDLLTHIAQSLIYLDDFLCFGAVCKAWQSANVLEEKPSLPPRFPLLMLIENEENKSGNSKNYENMKTFGSNDVLETQIYKIKLPRTSCKSCLGTKLGWLLTLSMDMEICLFHPFSRHQIQLPPCPSFDYLLRFGRLPFRYLSNPEPRDRFEIMSGIYVRKAALSSEPLKNTNNHESNECVVMAVFSGAFTLAFARPGDKAWTKVPMPQHLCLDVIYYKDQFHAINSEGDLVVCDIGDQNLRTRVIAAGPKGNGNFPDKYLVESMGDLLLVARALTFWIPGSKMKKEDYKLPHWTSKLAVFKLEQNTQEGSIYRYRWVEVNDLGNVALFLGSSSFSLPAPDIKGCYKTNCIYFTDDYDNKHCHDMGVFNLKDEVLEPCHLVPSYPLCSPPFWYI
ncbi:unnamed protein product [Ilex paraguariensis]|uniref:KIB1-4 beta-propeller domain-containing protein n=1 Tax=Ilex paraguariensis TaxID=185542 RepID=A0ABC8QQX7_9AQUA